MHDPAAYLTPDVVLDITDVTVERIGLDRVRIAGACGRPRPETLKVTASVNGGWLGEGEITYAGVNALARVRMAGETVLERIRRLGLACEPRSEEHTSELQSLMRISYAVFCLKKKKTNDNRKLAKHMRKIV